MPETTLVGKKRRWLFLHTQKQTQKVNWFDDSSVGKSNVFGIKSKLHDLRRKAYEILTYTANSH